LTVTAAVVILASRTLTSRNIALFNLRTVETRVAFVQFSHPYYFLDARVFYIFLTEFRRLDGARVRLGNAGPDFGTGFGVGDVSWWGVRVGGGAEYSGERVFLFDRCFGATIVGPLICFREKNFLNFLTYAS